MPKLISDETLFRVVHSSAFTTNAMVKDTTLVRATTREKVVEKFNLWSEDKRGLPYCYNKVTENDVYFVEILT